MSKTIWKDDDIILSKAKTLAPKQKVIWRDDDILLNNTPSQESEGVNNLPLSALQVTSTALQPPLEFAKGTARNTIGLLDVPFALTDLAAQGGNWLYKKFGGKNPKLGDEFFAPTNIRPGERLQEALRDSSGVDLRPNTDTAANRAFGTVGEWTGPGAALALLKKAANAAQVIKGSAKLGAISAGLQETGVDPLSADIMAMVGAPTVGLAKNVTRTAAKGLKGAVKGTNIDDKAATILRQTIGEENVPQVIERLKNTKAPLQADLPTAELAFNPVTGEIPNPGLARLHRALSPNIDAITQQTKANNDLIANQLQNIGIAALPTEIGESIRHPLMTNYQKYRTHRAKVSEPAYQEMQAITEKRIPEKAYQYLDKWEIPDQQATGGVKSLFDYYNKNLGRSIDTQKTTKRGSEIQGIYWNASPQIRKQLEEDVGKAVLNNTPTRSQPAKTPAQIDAFIKHTIKPKLNAHANKGEEELARYSKELKELLEESIGDTNYKKQYADLSKPVNEIRDNKLLGDIIKQDTFKQNYKVSPDLIPERVLSASTADTKALIKQIKDDKTALDVTRGAYIGHLFGGKDMLTYNQIHKFNHKYREKLPIVFTEPQVKVLRDAEDILHRRHLVQNVGRATGSNTQSETTLLNDLFGTASNKVAKYIAGKIPGGGALYEQTMETIAKQREAKLKDVIGRALVDPQFATILLERPSAIQPEQLQQTLRSIMTDYSKDLYNPAGIYSTYRDIQNQGD